MLTMKQIADRIPKLVGKVNEVLCRESDDEVIAILRYFDWNVSKVEESWFLNVEKYEKLVGITFDTELEKKVKDIHMSRKENNNGMCGICFLEFEEEEEYKAVSLSCGHQFNVLCWS